MRPKPWDFYGCTQDGRFWAAEAKSVRGPRFPLANFHPHQHEALARVEAIGGEALVFLNWRQGGVRGTGTALRVPYGEFAARCYAAERAGRKSLKVDDFQESCRLRRVTDGWE